MKIDTSKLVDEWNISTSSRDWIADHLAPRIDALNAEVGRLGIDKDNLMGEIFRLKERLSNAIEVDWSKAHALGFVAYFTANKPERLALTEGDVYFPRPAPVKREKTRDELGVELWDKGIHIDKVWISLSIETVHDLCRAAGIPLETEA